ncbi:alpha/beta fold hydrolase [Streptomyces sp. NPDC058773]|uniref:alpha/beta fold hydrolase n=1 Tax=Streptomyces sp. NPDC058773 TaxID=3346632 RepID=UPI00368A0BCF
MIPLRAELSLGGRRLSYLDFGGPGRPLVALHGHMSEGAGFAAVARELAPEWRVIAPDQRGHGDSDRAADYTREGYVADVAALLDHLGLARVPLLGHSLGGINAYQFTARHPDRVSALVNAEGPAEVVPDDANPVRFVSRLPYFAATREELLDGLDWMAPYCADGLRRGPHGGWRLGFHPQDLAESDARAVGDHWADWTDGGCPALLIVGSHGIIPAEQARAMAERRPGTRVVRLAGGHFVHTEDLTGFARVVREFLASHLPGTA